MKSEVLVKDIKRCKFTGGRTKVCASATRLLVSPIALAGTIRTLPGPPAAVLLFSRR